MLPHWDISVADPGAVETGRPGHGGRFGIAAIRVDSDEITICLLSMRQRFKVDKNRHE